MENDSQAIGDNPVYLNDLTGKSVEVVTIDGVTHEGDVYVIDPISRTIMLRTRDDRYRMTVIMHHAIKSFQVITQLPVYNDMEDPLLSTGDIEFRRNRLKNWLKKNLIEVQEDGPILKIQDSVQISPPYSIEQCSCSNMIVLERIVTLLERMPESN